MKAGVSEGQGRLINEVINRGICVTCGACVGLCPYFHYFDGRVIALDQCHSDTWRCLQICPRIDYDETCLDMANLGVSPTTEIGTYKKLIMARAANEKTRGKAQYGGAVSALLMFALKKGDIKSAVLTDAGGPLSPGGIIVKNKEGVLDCAGSRYSGSGGLSALNRAIKAGEDKIGVVGLPCQIEALARMGLMKPDGEERIKRVALRIGLFCTWAFDYRRLEDFLKKQTVEGAVLKYDIPPPPSDKFQVKTDKGWRDFPLSDLRPFIQEGCALCRDMTAELADLSVGTVEGMEGWNMVVLRTDSGTEMVSRAVKEGWLETKELPEENIEHLKKAARNKRERAKKVRIEDLRGSKS